MSLLTSRLVCGIPASSCALLTAEVLPIGRSSACTVFPAHTQRCSAFAQYILASCVSSASSSPSSSFSSLSVSSFVSSRSSSSLAGVVSNVSLRRALFSSQTNGNGQSQQQTPEGQQTQQTAEQKPASPSGNGNGAKSELSGEIEKLQSELSKVQEQLDACRRFAADLDNQRKRALEEAKKERMFAIQGFAKALLDVADTLEFALRDGKAAQDKESDTFKNVVTGIEMTQKNLEKAFEKGGVKKVAPLNEPFDPHRHEAIVQLENAHAPHNTVIEVFKCGYSLNDRTLRAAQVATSKKPAQPQA